MCDRLCAHTITNVNISFRRLTKNLSNFLIYLRISDDGRCKIIKIVKTRYSLNCFCHQEIVKHWLCTYPWKALFCVKHTGDFRFSVQPLCLVMFCSSFDVQIYSLFLSKPQYNDARRTLSSEQHYVLNAYIWCTDNIFMPCWVERIPCWMLNLSLCVLGIQEKPLCKLYLA